MAIWFKLRHGHGLELGDVQRSGRDMILVIAATITTRSTCRLGATARSATLLGTIFRWTRGLRLLFSKTSRIEVVGFCRLRCDCRGRRFAGLHGRRLFSDCERRRRSGRFGACFQRKIAQSCFRGLRFGLLNGSRHKSIGLKFKSVYSGGDRKGSSRDWLLPRYTSLDDSGENQFNLEFD